MPIIGSAMMIGMLGVGPLVNAHNAKKNCEEMKTKYLKAKVEYNEAESLISQLDSENTDVANTVIQYSTKVNDIALSLSTQLNLNRNRQQKSILLTETISAVIILTIVGLLLYKYITSPLLK